MPSDKVGGKFGGDNGIKGAVFYALAEFFIGEVMEGEDGLGVSGGVATDGLLEESGAERGGVADA